MTERRKNRISYCLGVLLAVVALSWICCSVNPGGGRRNAVKNDLTARLSVSVNNAKSDALGDVSYIEKVKKIPLADTVAPEPLEECYGTVSCENAGEMDAVIERAEKLGVLDGQRVIFSKDAVFNTEKDIQYYLDDTILAICWSEIIDGRVCNCAEVKVKDASQLRRKIYGDSFGSTSGAFTTDYSRQTKAVVAMNGDYYAFREYGICVYQGELRRFSERHYSSGNCYNYNYVETLFVDKNGDFSFLKNGEETTRDEMESFVEENGVMFSLSFGPVLVDEYEVQKTVPYPIGEGDVPASRAGIGQYDKLHYLYMNVQSKGMRGASTDEFAAFMAQKNLRCAYNLDGGQTAEFTIHNRDYNNVDRGGQRYVSDIIYFASAAGIKE